VTGGSLQPGDHIEKDRAGGREDRGDDDSDEISAPSAGMTAARSIEPPPLSTVLGTLPPEAIRRGE
jgi:hypothetical protein